MQLRTDRVDELPFDAASFWRRIAQVDEYPGWWPWLRRFDATDLSGGRRWNCTVHPPVPYSVSFSIDLDQVVDRERIEARVSGDIVGWARLTVEDTSSGCRIRLVSKLAPRARSLRVVSLLARPLASFGHHWILAAGVRQFTERSRD